MLVPDSSRRGAGLHRLARGLAAVPVALGIAGVALAGPPFLTDDPEPVPYQHGEFYLAAAVAHDHDGWSGAMPQVEINYGALPELQLHVIAPLAFDSPAHGHVQYGYGDTELGMKYRFVRETARMPQVAAFPLVELPTGDSGRGLGGGETDVLFPVWLQKSWGPWTTYGGGGYWVNPGEGNRDWWLFGWLAQYRLLPSATLGAEVVHETPKETGGDAVSRVQAGAIVDFNDTCHLLLSAGNTVEGPDEFRAYVAFQLTWSLEADPGGSSFPERQ